MSGMKGGGWKTIVGGLALELVVVFIGVYGAAALSSHQERQRDNAHKDQIRHALIAEINDITHNSASTYYDTNGKLKPKYQWYFNNLKTIRDIASAHHAKVTSSPQS